ncbi:MAG: hypothetical protein JXR34_03950, partial [Bacteroidales bacterium]|nr:hypothetical protein [Bacteroidales bacterium]
ETQGNQTENGGQVGQNPETAQDTAAAIAQVRSETQGNQTENGGQVGQNPETAQDSAATLAQANQDMQNTEAEAFKEVLTAIKAKEETVKNLIVNNQNKTNTIASIIIEERKTSNELATQITELQQDFQKANNEEGRGRIKNQINQKSESFFESQQKLLTAIEIYENYNYTEENAIERLTKIENSIEEINTDSIQEISTAKKEIAFTLNRELDRIENDLNESLSINSTDVNISIDDIYRLESDNTINKLELNRIEKEIEMSAGERQLTLISQKDSLLNLIEQNTTKIAEINKRNSQVNASNYIISRLDNSNNIDTENGEKVELTNLESIKNDIDFQTKQTNRVLAAVTENEPNIVATNTNFEQQLIIKNYGTEEQNQVAQNQLQPLIQKATRNQLIHKELINQTSVTNKLLNNEIQNLNEIEDALSQVDLTIKTTTSESELTELQENKTELVQQYNESLAKANAIKLLNRNLIQLNNKVLSDIEQINIVFQQADQAISVSDFKNAKSISSNLKLNYSDTALNISNQIATVTSQVNQEISALKNENKRRISSIAKSQDKIISLENQRQNIEAEAYLADNDNKKSKSLNKVQDIEAELSSEIQKYNVLRTKIQPIENQIIQKELIVKSLNEIQSTLTTLPIIATTEASENKTFAESEALSEQIDKIAEAVVLQTDTSSLHNETAKIKYFNELDQIVIKRFYLENELLILNSHINSLRIRRSRVNDLSTKSEISDDIEDAEAEVEDIEEEIAQLTEREEYLRTLGYTLVYGNYATTDTSVATEMLKQSQELKLVADSLEQLATQNRGKLRKSLNLQAKALNQNAMQLILTSVDIRASQNKTKFLANLVEANTKLNQVENDVMQNQGLVLLESGISNYELAAENREALKNPKLTNEERQQILQEAENLEQLAINQQVQAINLINSTVANSGRGAEEIPTDSPIIANIDSATVENEQVAENQNPAQSNTTDYPSQSQIQQTNTEVEPIVVERPTNLTVEVIDKMNRKELLSLDESLLSPEVQRKVQLKKSESIGIYVSQNQPNSVESFYNESKPIEIQQDLPEGLIYKIQIAAFRNTVNPNLIVGITPISIEQRPNSAWYRYMAGVFTAYDDAVGARNQIRQVGYTDAFIVPYFNGQRITVAQARQLIQSGQAFTDKKIAEVAIAANKTTYTATAPSQPTAAGTTSAPTTISPDAIPQGDFSTPELFYSVQIGVFGGSRTKDRLLNLDDLMYDRMPNGYYRYFNGKYTDVNSALTMQREIRNRGIRDAFVVAFYNGQKISINRAREITANNALQQPEITPNQNVTPVINPPIEPTPTEPEVNTQNTNIQDVTQDTATYNIIYKVQIGAFKSNIPVATVNSMLQLPFTIEKQTKADGLNVYLVGNFENYNDAVNMKNQVVNLGIPEAFVVAYVNGNQRSVQDALQLQRK